MECEILYEKFIAAPSARTQERVQLALCAILTRLQNDLTFWAALNDFAASNPNPEVTLKLVASREFGQMERTLLSKSGMPQEIASTPATRMVADL